MAMMQLPYIKLPANYLTLLKKNRQQGAGQSEDIDRFIKANPSLKGPLKMHFGLQRPEGREGEVLKGLGWAGVRDRLALIYLSYLKNGDFNTIDKLLARELLVFEDKAKEFSPNSSSRAFMLAFYLKAVSFIPGGPFYQMSLGEIVQEEVFFLLREQQFKSQSVDWPIIFLTSMISFFGKDLVKRSLDKKIPLDQIYPMIARDKRRLMLKSFLQYSASIEDPHLFVPIL